MRANKWKGVRDSDFKFQWTEWIPSEEKKETRIGEGDDINSVLHPWSFRS